MRFGVVVALLWAACIPPLEHCVPVSRRASGRGGIAIKLILRDVQISAVICEGEIVVNLVLVAFEAEAAPRAENHVVMHFF